MGPEGLTITVLHEYANSLNVEAEGDYGSWPSPEYAFVQPGQAVDFSSPDPQTGCKLLSLPVEVPSLIYHELLTTSALIRPNRNIHWACDRNYNLYWYYLQR